MLRIKIVFNSIMYEKVLMLTLKKTFLCDNMVIIINSRLQQNKL